MAAAELTQQGFMEQLGFVSDNQLAGYRLDRIEVLNWGTFDGQVWTAELGGNNTLLTGQIGSGKSTIVDAITTLMVPSRSISYNKASGAHAKERSLHSYVMGQYKHERSSTGNSRPTYLRDAKSYSVILAVFRNEGYDETVTIAQMFVPSTDTRRPDPLYVVAPGNLSIGVDFANFDKGVDGLRRRLRAAGAMVTTSPSEYNLAMRQALSINNPQALKLFNQAISMKEVGNLTDFVRSHMLEPTGATERIESLITHFEDLDQAHQSIKRAAHQIQLLQPLAGYCGQYRSAKELGAALRAQREAVHPFYTDIHINLLEAAIADCDQKVASATSVVQEADQALKRANDRISQVSESIFANGGGRLEQLQRELENETSTMRRRREVANRYATLTQQIGLLPATSADLFLKQQTSLADERASITATSTALDAALDELKAGFRKAREDEKSISSDLESLRNQPSNIDRGHREIQHRLAQALNIKPEDIPFVGELIQVREDCAEWEGAAERALRGFGLSMLVSDDHYAAVSGWVNENHLRQRFVYFRVSEARQKAMPAIHSRSLVRKLSVKPDSGFYEWLETEIAHRFNLACCETQAEFHRESNAITQKGQVKTSGGRHEKDDRHHITDRRNYVLGWTNDAKIRALEEAQVSLRATVAAASAALSAKNDELNVVRERGQTLARLDEFQTYRDMDWETPARDVARLKAEVSKLEAASDVLAQLRAEAQQLNQEIAVTSDRRATAAGLVNAEASKRQDHFELLQEKQHELDAAVIDSEMMTALTISKLEVFGNTDPTLKTIIGQAEKLKDHLQGAIDDCSGTAAEQAQRAIRAMTEFRNSYRAESAELEVSMEGASEFEALLARLVGDDLPRFERDFKVMLNTNTINEIGGFNSYLAGERDKIKDSIAKINKSLLEIDYNEGRYIKLEPTQADDNEIRDFQLSLRACTDGAAEDVSDEQYSEDRFNRVKAIIDRFRGQDGMTEIDRRWTDKVTDVRQWFTFAVSERYRHDDTEHEMYEDSSGKSGGQKEKLAYTVLAASLAYQFGLAWGETRSRSFRFVVIDEAFGRSSDTSTRYALDLFQKLNLQLLIVTPAQKIHVIEPYVSGVVLAIPAPLDGRSSLLNITMQEFQQRKAVHLDTEIA